MIAQTERTQKTQELIVHPNKMIKENTDPCGKRFSQFLLKTKFAP